MQIYTQLEAPDFIKIQILAKEKGIKTTRRKIRDALSSLPEHELFIPLPARDFSSIVEKGVGKGYRMDLLDMSTISRHN